MTHVAASLTLPLALATALGCRSGATPAEIALLNVSYDPTRELYAEIDAAFARRWKERTGQTVLVRQSHGGSARGAGDRRRALYGPRDPEVAARHAGTFPKIELVTVDGVFGGWKRAQAEHFADGGIFDRIYQPGG